jgi:hypothetical protein
MLGLQSKYGLWVATQGHLNFRRHLTRVGPAQAPVPAPVLGTASGLRRRPDFKDVAVGNQHHQSAC